MHHEFQNVEVFLLFFLGKEARTEWNGHKYRCEKCGRDITSREDFKRHALKTHPTLAKKAGYLFLCPQCPFVTYNVRSGRKHTKAHRLPDAKSCPNCPFIGAGLYWNYHQKLCRYSRDTSAAGTSHQRARAVANDDVTADDEDVADKVANEESVELTGKQTAAFLVLKINYRVVMSKCLDCSLGNYSC